MQQWYKLRKEYERNEHNVHIKLALGNVITNPYDEDSENKTKKKKKQKDMFQKLIEKMFAVCEEEMWKQRNLDRHKPKNKSNYATIIHVDR